MEVNNHKITTVKFVITNVNYRKITKFNGFDFCNYNTEFSII